MLLATIILVVFGIAAIFFYLSTRTKVTALSFTFFGLGLLFVFGSLAGSIYALNVLGLINLSLENYISTILFIIGALIVLFFILTFIFIIINVFKIDKRTKRLKELGLIEDEE